MTVLPDGVAAGHGDGRLVYPPQPGSADVGPVPTQRWELLREGLEDVDRLALLQCAVHLREERGDAAAPEVLRGRELVGVPAHIASGRSSWIEDPAALEAWRRMVALSLEDVASPLPPGWEESAPRVTTAKDDPAPEGCAAGSGAAGPVALDAALACAAAALVTMRNRAGNRVSGPRRVGAMLAPRSRAR
jgi:hypothetical protein